MVEGLTLGRYTLHAEIASGGMATVYIGRLIGPVGFGRTVAIKRLHAPYAQDVEFVKMFLDEARLCARIRHPNVVPTFDVVAETASSFSSGLRPRRVDERARAGRALGGDEDAAACPRVGHRRDVRAGSTQRTKRATSRASRSGSCTATSRRRTS